jgi:hypothetical protein
VEILHNNVAFTIPLERLHATQRIIGKTQGVKANNKPNPKKLSKVRKNESCCKDWTDYEIPHGTPKFDEAFGDVEILHNNVAFTIPLDASSAGNNSASFLNRFSPKLKLLLSCCNGLALLSVLTGVSLSQLTLTTY